jgi:hypothetical protein
LEKNDPLNIGFPTGRGPQQKRALHEKAMNISGVRDCLLSQKTTVRDGDLPSGAGVYWQYLCVLFVYVFLLL